MSPKSQRVKAPDRRNLIQQSQAPTLRSPAEGSFAVIVTGVHKSTVVVIKYTALWAYFRATCPGRRKRTSLEKSLIYTLDCTKFGLISGFKVQTNLERPRIWAHAVDPPYLYDNTIPSGPSVPCKMTRGSSTENGDKSHLQAYLFTFQPQHLLCQDSYITLYIVYELMSHISI